MKVLPLATALMLCLSGISFAQAPASHRAIPKQRQAQTLPRPSPAELRRCSLSHKILNATAKSACGKRAGHS
jgi:hypothetical protein